MTRTADTKLDRAWAEGYAAGQARQPVGDVWVETPIRWRHVTPGDILRMNAGRLWMVDNAAPDPTGRIQLSATAGLDTVLLAGHNALDPDGVVHVLEKFTATEALTLTRDQLGARVIARKVQP